MFLFTFVPRKPKKDFKGFFLKILKCLTKRDCVNSRELTVPIITPKTVFALHLQLEIIYCKFEIRVLWPPVDPLLLTLPPFTALNI